MVATTVASSPNTFNKERHMADAEPVGAFDHTAPIDSAAITERYLAPQRRTGFTGKTQARPASAEAIRETTQPLATTVPADPGQ